MKLRPLHVGAVALGLALVLGAARASGPPSPRPVTVRGDSYAVGMGAALRAEGWPVAMDAKVGRSTRGQVGTDPHGWQVVSIGTNDLAGFDSVENIGQRVLGIMAGGGRAAVLVMPTRARDARLRERMGALAAYVVPTLREWGVPVLVHQLEPEAPDGLHYSPAQYRELALAAVRLLD